MPDTKLTFAKAYQELQSILAASESSTEDLEKSIGQYKRATELSQFLKKELQKMTGQIEEISLQFDKEEPAAPPVEPEGDQTDIPF